jgi:hypothetical protein
MAQRTRIEPFRGSPCESRASALDDDQRFGVINHINSIQRQLPLHEAALAYTAAQSCASRDCRSLLMVLSDTGLRSSERSIHRTNTFNQNHSVSDVFGPH